MVALSILRWVILGGEVVMAGPVFYVCVLAIAAIIITKRHEARRKAGPPAREAARNRFAILVPAHDEELLLSGLLTSLSNLDYPNQLYTTYVIADNCTDKTAELARSFDGVRVFERIDATKRGKGYALGWMFQQLEERRLIYDACAVIDADSVVEPDFLLWMDHELKQGAEALQAHYTVLNPTDAPSTALRWIALTLKGYIQPLSRSRLGGSSTLTGNGMCFSRSLLQRCPWQAFGLSEDYQFYLLLVQHGERVRYVPEAIVRSVMPVTFTAMRTQDIRWETIGAGITTRQIASGLFRAGWRLRRFACFEAIAELFLPSLSLLVAGPLLALIAALALGSLPVLLGSGILLAGLALYIGSAFYLLRPPASTYRALLYMPGFMLWKLWVLFVLRKQKKYTAEWIRTSRTAS